jgi:hypothetical protein
MSKPNIPTEEQEQMALFEWAETMVHINPELRWLYAIHNGLRLSVGMRVKAKRLGTKKGVADVCLPVARGGYHGLYIELKRQKGGVFSEEQMGFVQFCDDQGYLYLGCAGWGIASRNILLYLSMRHEPH